MATKTAVVFYSRTGATRKLATSLAARLQAATDEIRCPLYRPGGLRYLLAGYHSVKGRLPPIERPSLDLFAFDLVLLGTPIWTSHPSLPMRSFLAEKPDLPKQIGVFLSFGGHSPAEEAVDEFAALLPRPPVASLAVSQRDLQAGDFSTAIDRFAKSLNETNQI